MAAKRKSTKKKVAKKAAPRKKATASTESKRPELNELRYSSGKLDDDTVSRIEEIEDIVEKKYNTKEREETILRAFDKFVSKL